MYDSDDRPGFGVVSRDSKSTGIARLDANTVSLSLASIYDRDSHFVNSVASGSVHFRRTGCGRCVYNQCAQYLRSGFVWANRCQATRSAARPFVTNTHPGAVKWLKMHHSSK